jgi:hypothetical protein
MKDSAQGLSVHSSLSIRKGREFRPELVPFAVSPVAVRSTPPFDGLWRADDLAGARVRAGRLFTPAGRARPRFSSGCGYGPL